MATRRLVLVEWVDSHSGRGWRDLDELEGHAQPLHCRSVGWVIAKKNGMLLLAASISGERNGNVQLCASGDIAIPSAAIRSIRDLGSERRGSR